MQPRRYRLVAIAAVAGWALMASGAAAQSAELPSPATAPVEKAIDSGTRYLLGRITDAGRCKSEYPEGSIHFGGKTGLLVYAALSAGAPAETHPLRQSIAWLAKADLRGTYARAMRACALARLPGKQPHPQLARDVAWLIAAARADGSYSYGAADKTGDDRYDNSNSHWAVLGVWAGMQRGIRVPEQWWQRVEKHWRRQQQVDGGWGYVNRPGQTHVSSYGSMTAAGLVTMHLCMDVLHRGEYVRPIAEPFRPVDDGMAWLDKNYRVDINPRKGVNYYYYYLHALGRVGATAGHKHFGGHEWFAECTAEVLDRQNGDGSWASGDRASETALAVLFLVNARQPVLINKLRYSGKWNVRPRDAAALARYVQATFERGVAWQVVDIDTPEPQWRDAPFLYISGAGRVEFTDRQIARLRSYALHGGLIISESAGNSGSFTLDMLAAYERIFPDLKARRLPINHPVYNGYFAPKHVGGLYGVSNGVRLLAIHAPRELSLALQLGPDRGDHRAVFELMSNIYILHSDRGNLPPRGSSNWPSPAGTAPTRTIRLAVVKHQGNCNVEPAAFRRQALLMRNQCGIDLQVSGPLDPAELSAERHPVASLTGTDAMALTAAQQAALKRYVHGGGTLIVHAAGGSTAFNRSVREQILPIVPNDFDSALPDRIALSGPIPLKRVYFRRQVAMALGGGARRHRLRHLSVPGTGAMTGRSRPAVILSDDDLISGVLGNNSYAIRGYLPRTAVAMMANLISNADDNYRKLQQPAPATQPPAAPRTAPATTRPAKPGRPTPDEEF